MIKKLTKVFGTSCKLKICGWERTALFYCLEWNVQKVQKWFLWYFQFLMHALPQYCFDDEAELTVDTILNFASSQTTESQLRICSHEREKNCTKNAPDMSLQEFNYLSRFKSKRENFRHEETRELKRHQEKAFFAVEVLLIQVNDLLQLQGIRTIFE